MSPVNIGLVLYIAICGVLLYLVLKELYNNKNNDK